jgi:chromosome segregation ATPase
MEFQMNGSASEPAETAKEVVERSQQANVVIMPTEASCAEGSSGRSEPVMAAEDLSTAIEHFSHLSSGMTKILSDLSRIVQGSAEQLKAIQSAVEVKKSELKSLEAQVESERRTREEEKMHQSQQENEYVENLKIQRQREEEEYKRAWDLEKAKARQQLDEELRLIRQENRLKQEAIERDCLRREMALKEKEVEWVQLTQELEQFMSRLGRRIQSRTGQALDI